MGVHRHADDPSGSLADKRLARCEKRRMRAAIAMRHAKSLCAADDHISAHLTRRNHQREDQEIGRDRRVAFASTTLAAMKSAGAAAGGGATVNDAVLSVSAGALRRLFVLRGEEIPDEFVALVPMSIRKPGEELALGNRITTLMVPLPLAEAAPLARLRQAH